MTRKELFEINIERPDELRRIKAKERFDAIAKPIDGLGTLEEMICRIAAVQKADMPDISKKALIIMIADNGVVAEGVSQTGSDVTAKVAALMAEGRSSAGIMAGAAGSSVEVIPVDVGIDLDESIPGLVYKRVARGTGDIVKEKAMSEEECLAAVSAGIEAAGSCERRGIKIVATGEMGIGNTTTATAVLCAITGRRVEDTVGAGAGLSEAGLNRKTYVIKRALELHKLNNTDKITPSREAALDILRSVGGLDIAALAGVYIGCGMYHMTAVVDGLISAAAALAAECLVPGVRYHMLASHCGRERGCAEALSLLGLKSVIDANMALGEGTGALMLFPLLDMVMALYREGTAFSETSIGRYERFDK